MVAGVGGRFLLIKVKEIRRHRTRHSIAVDAVAIQVRRSDLRLAGLVDIEELEQLDADGPDIAKLQHGLAANLLLHVQVEVLDVGRAHVRIDGKEISFGSESSIDWNSGRDYGAGCATFTQSIRPQTGIGWPRTEAAIPRQMGQEHILRKRIVEQAPSGANYGFALARHVISRGDAGSEVVEILAIQLAGGNVVAAVRVIDGIELAARCSGDAEVGPAHPVVQSRPRSGAEAVLNEQPVAVLEGVSF